MNGADEPKDDHVDHILLGPTYNPMLGNKYCILLDVETSVMELKPYVSPPWYKRFFSSVVNGLRFALQVVKYALIGWVALLCSVLTITLVWYSLYAAVKYILTQFGLQ